MGRKRKPDKLKEAQGTLNTTRAKTDKQDPHGSTQAWVAPDWLSDTALLVWDRLYDQVNGLGILHSVDKLKFAMMCESAGNFIEITKYLRGKSVLSKFTETGSQGQVMSNPLQRELRNSIDIFNKLAGEFAIGPSARASFNLDALGGSDSDDEFGDL